MTPASEISVMIVDDHPLVREGLSALIQLERDMRVVAEADGGSRALELFRQRRPDVLLMDLRLQGDSGARVIREIRAEFPAARVLVVSSCDEAEEIHDALSAGAMGWLSKNVVEDSLVDAIREINAGRGFCPNG
jgi:DNA-binding NarL/FixJ family response regulator